MMSTDDGPTLFVVPQHAKPGRGIDRIATRHLLMVKATIMLIPLNDLPNVCITDDTWDSLLSLRARQTSMVTDIQDARCKLYGHEYVPMRGAKMCRVCCRYLRAGY